MVKCCYKIGDVMFNFNGNAKIKDYSSDKMQDKTFFQDIGEFSFDKNNKAPKSQIKKDVHILSNVVKAAKTLPKSKKIYLQKLIGCIKTGKINFKDGLTYDRVIKIINLSSDDIYDLITQDTESILYKVCKFSNIFVKEEKEDEIRFLRNRGISEDEVINTASKINALIFVKNYFIKQEQYEILYENYLKNSSLEDKSSVKKLADKLPEVLDSNQKEELARTRTSYYDMALAIIFHGRNTEYRFSYIKKVLSPENFNDKDREPVRNFMRGFFEIDYENKTFKKTDKEFKIGNDEYFPDKKTDRQFKRCIKSVILAKIFKNHSYMINLVNEAKRRYLEIPKVLVNFDSHSDIYINNAPNLSIADWVNTVVTENNIKDVYWVCPAGIYDYRHVFSHFLGEGDHSAKQFHGNYSKNLVYRDLRKPLKQTFLINTSNGTIISESVNYTQKEIEDYLKNSIYKLVNIYICTPENLPKIKEDMILSIDADFFNCNGFDTAYWTEQMPFDTKRVFDKFMRLWCKNICRVKILGMCISPEYIGYSSFGLTSGFYEYILKIISEQSKNYYG